MKRLLFASVLLLFASLCANARDDDPVKAKLTKAKEAYAKEMDQYQTEVTAYFDKREEAARKDSNKKLVDQILAERKTYEDLGDLPKAAPLELRQKAATAKTAMEAAYATAVKEFTKAKKDEDAVLTEKQGQAFSKLVGKWQDINPVGNLFLLKADGSAVEYMASGKENSTGEWEVDKDGKVAIRLKNGFTVSGKLPDKEGFKTEVFGPNSEKAIASLTLRKRSSK